MAEDLDRYITGHYGEDQFSSEPLHRPCEGEGCDGCEGTGLDLERMQQHRDLVYELRLERGC